MNITDNIKKNINLDKIKELDGDLYELALARMVCIELSKYYYRDETFFLFKENLVDRVETYNKDPIPGKKNITCNSLCKILEKILKAEYSLDVKINSAFSDRFAHKDLILTTKNNKKYIINPLMDLVEYKVGFETTNFASKKMADFYQAKVPDISYISPDELLLIDNTIGYTTNGKYKNFDNAVCNNIGEAINVIMNNRGYLNGIVDLKIFSSLKIKELMNKHIDIKDIYIDDKNNLELRDLEFNNNGRYRGLLINDLDCVYLFPVNGSYVKYSNNEWDRLVNSNSIKINTYAYVNNLSKLKEYGIDRDILHNRKFLEVFSYYENLCMKNNKDILDYIEYTKTYIRVKYNCDLLFYIDGNNLVMVDYLDKRIERFVFIDESEVKSVKSNFVELNNTLIDEYMNKTDVLGMFEMNVNNSNILDYVTKYNDKYLSRNYQQYYVFDSVKDLLDRREKLINILINENSNLNNDEKYVVLENILNVSARLYYLSGLSNSIELQTDKINGNYDMFVSDIINFVSFMKKIGLPLEFKDYKEMNDNFNIEEVLHRKIQVEFDNKSYILNYVNELVKLFKDLELEDYFVITPGYGSIYLGPFVSSMTDKYSSLLLYSQYKKTGIERIDNNRDFKNLIVNSSRFNGNQIILLDDNMGTGTTMKTIRNGLNSCGYDVKLTGSYQYTFDRLQEFSIRDRGQELFNVYEQDLLTPINYPRHQILESAVARFKDSPQNCISYLNLFGYHSNLRSDYQQMVNDSLFYYNRFTGKNLYQDELLKESSQKLIKRLLKNKGE